MIGRSKSLAAIQSHIIQTFVWQSQTPLRSGPSSLIHYIAAFYADAVRRLNRLTLAFPNSLTIWPKLANSLYCSLLCWRSTPRKSVDTGFRTTFSSMWAFKLYAFASVIFTQCFVRTFAPRNCYCSYAGDADTAWKWSLLMAVTPRCRVRKDTLRNRCTQFTKGTQCNRKPEAWKINTLPAHRSHVPAILQNRLPWENSLQEVD